VGEELYRGVGGCGPAGRPGGFRHEAHGVVVLIDYLCCSGGIANGPVTVKRRNENALYKRGIFG
jgi:hypothetical protein